MSVVSKPLRCGSVFNCPLRETVATQTHNGAAIEQHQRAHQRGGWQFPVFFGCQLFQVVFATEAPQLTLMVRTFPFGRRSRRSTICMGSSAHGRCCAHTTGASGQWAARWQGAHALSFGG